jgi:MobA/MobL family
MSAVAGWYHCSVKPVSRSAGRSAVAAAAYRLGESLHDRQLGETYDYTRRSGVMTAFTVAPLNAPDWVHDPEALWNAAEAAETRINSQVAREYELALPSSVGADAREGSSGPLPKSWSTATALPLPLRYMSHPATATSGIFMHTS